jgi:hypothetical protein
VIHRREEDRATGVERNTDLARLKAGGEWNPIRLRADADYEVSQNDAVTLQRSVVFVGEGKGDYNELGEEVGKGKGSFTVVFLPTTDTTPVHTVGFNLRLQWKPSQASGQRGGPGGWLLRNLARPDLGVREETTTSRRGRCTRCPLASQRQHHRFGTTTLRQTGRSSRVTATCRSPSATCAKTARTTAWWRAREHVRERNRARARSRRD